MKKIHPNTLIFFDKFKNVIAECQKKGEINIVRYSADERSEHGVLNPYSNLKEEELEEEFNYAFNYYYEKNYDTLQKITSFVRYHVVNKENNNNNDLSEQLITDLKNSFMNENVGFQLVIQYFASHKIDWMTMFFEQEMIKKDRIKLFNILGPSARFHEMINYYSRRPQYYPIIVQCFLHHGSDYNKDFYKDIMEYFLDNEYIDQKLRNNYIDMAIKITTKHILHFQKLNQYEQISMFNIVREVTDPDEWIKFKKAFPLVKMNATKHTENILLTEIPTPPIFTKKINVDISAISQTYNIFMLENDIRKTLYIVEEYIEDNENNLFGYNKMNIEDSIIYIESYQPIEVQLFMNVIETLFRELSSLSYQEFNTAINDNKVLNLDDIKKYKNNDKKEKYKLIKKYISKIILEKKLSKNKGYKTKMMKIKINKL